MTMLSPHFALHEFVLSNEAVRAGIDNSPTPEILANIKRLAATMEQVRILLGQPIIVSSGYRCPKLNARVGGSKKSAHMFGLAADFICPRFGSPLEVARAIAKSAIGFDQLIHEGSWVHLGLSENGRRELLTADFRGRKVTYSMGLIQIA